MPPADEDDDHDHRHCQIPTTNRQPPCFATLKTVFLDSFEILLSNTKLLSSILLLLALPLSLLLSSLFLSSATLRRRIVHLESLASIISVRIEALNILEEARKDAKALFRLRALHALLTVPLSTLVIISSVSSAASLLLRRRRPTVTYTVIAVKSTWWRALLTGVLAHAVAIVYGQVVRTAAQATGPATGTWVSVLTVVLEVFLKSVLDMGMVMSVVEERFGVDAFRLGWGLMAGRRMVGWAVAGAAEVATWVIGWQMVGMEEIDVYGGDLKGLRSMTWMGLGWKAGLASLYALVVVWSNVVLTALYCDCRRRKHVGDYNVVEL